jgi:hypothetical protein
VTMNDASAFSLRSHLKKNSYWKRLGYIADFELRFYTWLKLFKYVHMELVERPKHFHLCQKPRNHREESSYQ